MLPRSLRKVGAAANGRAFSRCFFIFWIMSVRLTHRCVVVCNTRVRTCVSIKSMSLAPSGAVPALPSQMPGRWASVFLMKRLTFDPGEG